MLGRQCPDDCTHDHNCQHEHLDLIMHYRACERELRQCIIGLRKVREAQDDNNNAFTVLLSYMIDACSAALTVIDSTRTIPPPMASPDLN